MIKGAILKILIIISIGLFSTRVTAQNKINLGLECTLGGNINFTNNVSKTSFPFRIGAAANFHFENTHKEFELFQFLIKIGMHRDEVRYQVIEPNITLIDYYSINLFVQPTILIQSKLPKIKYIFGIRGNFTFDQEFFLTTSNYNIKYKTGYLDEFIDDKKYMRTQTKKFFPAVELGIQYDYNNIFLNVNLKM